MITKIQLLAQLSQFNIPKGKPVIVHCSMRAVGKVEGGAQTLLDALIQRFTLDGGILCVPTHTWANFEDKKDITLDYTQNKTCTGALSDVALVDRRAHRSKNPTHSIVAFGEKAKEFASLDDNVLTPCAIDGCYGKIIKDDGYVVLIGVGQEKNTLLHAVEEILDVPKRLSASPVKMAIKNLEGKISYREFHFMTEEVCDVSINFPKYEPAFRYNGGIEDAKLGNANVQICSAKIMNNVMATVRERSNGQEILENSAPLAEFLYR